MKVLSDIASIDLINECFPVWNACFPELQKEELIEKHLKNPFGVSKLYYAIHEEAIIGVRAVMNTLSGSENHALQPVDTATHPRFQGLGVFRALTQKMLEESGQQTIFFNTPNLRSLPQYKKYGWSVIDKIRFSFAPVIGNYIEFSSGRDVGGEILDWRLKFGPIEKKMYQTLDSSLIYSEQLLYGIPVIRIHHCFQKLGVIDLRSVPLRRRPFFYCWLSSSNGLLEPAINARPLFSKKSSLVIAGRNNSGVPVTELDFDFI